MNLKEMKMLVKMKTAMGETIDQSLLDSIAEEEAKAEQEQQKEAQIAESRKTAFQSIFQDLSKDIGKLIAEDKKRTTEQQAVIDQFAGLLNSISNQEYKPPVVEQKVEPVAKEKVELVVEAPVAPIVEKKPKKKSLVDATVEKVTETVTAPSMFVQPEPELVGKDLKAIQQKIKLLEGWVSKISMTGPGGGAVKLYDLDDVAHYPTKNALDGQALVYNGTTKKWEPHFLITTDDIAPAYPNDGDLWYNTTDAHVYIWLVENDIGQWVDIAGGGGGNIVPTTTVTSSTYTVAAGDEYVGVNYAGTCTITLPATPATGRMIIIKDESGHCSTNPIVLVGTVDNDTGGATLRIDNGALQLLYRAGWRIV